MSQYLSNSQETKIIALQMTIMITVGLDLLHVKVCIKNDGPVSRCDFICPLKGHKRELRLRSVAVGACCWHPKLWEKKDVPLLGVWRSPPGMEGGHCLLIAQRKRSPVGLQGMLTNRVADCSCARLRPRSLCQNAASADLQRLPRAILFCCQPRLDAEPCPGQVAKTEQEQSPPHGVTPSPWDLAERVAFP